MLVFLSSSDTSTPFVFALIPAIDNISDKLPFITANFEFISIFSTTSFLFLLAPAPTGSSMTGTFFAFAILGAVKKASILSIVPIFTTRADDIEIMSSNSSI